MTDSSDTSPTIVVGQNSYVSLADANAIADARLFNAPWQSAGELDQTRALITATSLLDNMRWAGRPVLPTQPLAWPRVPDRCPPGYPLAVEIPDAIAAATVHLAMHMLGTGELPGGPAIMQQMLGDSMVMHFAHLADDLPKHVRRQIEPFLRCRSVNVAEVEF